MNEGSLCCGGPVERIGRRVKQVTHLETCEFYLRSCCGTVAKREVGHVEGCPNDPGLVPPVGRA